ncbi:MAG: response regulator [Candidatus Latescibacteria bacterium]|jgi:DNA-binding NtrC family response regulator|nr:response regulator [Candidatus Latescibacterota bacterium]MBT4139601.1 response regulator [Candidatus Latescibacterota bacterium]MBT5828573.1 response regulator [Candidatus Latescibacterota bacterium]
MTESHTLNILIVDDEKVMHTMLSAFISELGHQSHSAYNGADAFQTIQDQSFDLVLTDVKMPGMDGLELLEKIRKHTPDLPVVVITGHGDPEMSDKAKVLGAHDFIIKPVGLRPFMELVQEISEQKNAPQE